MFHLRTSAVVAAFLVFLPLAFSEELAQGLYEAIANPSYQQLRPLWALPALDALLLLLFLAVAVRQWRRAADGPRRSLVLWWMAAAMGTIGLDVMLEMVARSRYAKLPGAMMWIDIASSMAYVALSAILLATTFGIVPARRRTRDVSDEARERREGFGAALPLLIGTLAAYIAGAIWDRYLECTHGVPYSSCGGSINTEYFAQLSQVIPILLIAVGLESRLYRRIIDGPAYGMVIVAVLVLTFGEILAITALTRADGQAPGVTLNGWHEYFAFVVSIEALFVGVATLIWAITLRSRESEPQTPPAPPNKASTTPTILKADDSGYRSGARLYTAVVLLSVAAVAVKVMRSAVGASKTQ